MSNSLIVHKGRTNVIPVSLNMDVAGDTISSEIRAKPSAGSELIATWDVSFETDGSDGEIILTLDDSDTVDIAYTRGYMDLKRVTAGEPVPVFDKPLHVEFKDVVTE